VVELAVIVELRERELSEWENTLVVRGHGMVEAEWALRRAHMECDVIRDWAGVIQPDNRARVRASIVSQWHSLEFDQVLSGC
jgi:hypothetical protein